MFAATCREFCDSLPRSPPPLWLFPPVMVQPLTLNFRKNGIDTQWLVHEILEQQNYTAFALSCLVCRPPAAGWSSCLPSVHTAAELVGIKCLAWGLLDKSHGYRNNQKRWFKYDLIWSLVVLCIRRSLSPVVTAAHAVYISVYSY